MSDKTRTPLCGFCRVGFVAETERHHGIDPSVRVKIWKCRGCGDVKIVSSAEQLSLWEKAREHYTLPKQKEKLYKRTFQCIVDLENEYESYIELNPKHRKCPPCSKSDEGTSGCGGGCGCS